MQVSAINANTKNLSAETVSSVNIKGFDDFQDSALNIYASLNNKQTDDSELYYNIRLWKHFCQKQIAAGNLDIVV